MARRRSPGVVWRTVRHLKVRQVAGQLRTRLQRLVADPARFVPGDAPPVPALRPDRSAPPAPGAQRNAASALLAGRMRFLNDEREVGWPPDWRAADASRLWRYNLHYFEWLWPLDWSDARAATLDWLERHPPGRDRDGWEPYPVSLRLMSWVAVLWGRHAEPLVRDDVVRERLWRSVHHQTEWLRARLETHLLGNHLLENAAALTYVGARFDAEIGARWLAEGLALLETELAEQLPSDGMHFERSPMYHARVVWLLRLLSTIDAPGLDRVVRPALDRALDALTCVVHPDGEIALFNDSAFGIANPPRELLGDRVPRDGAWALHDAGYYGFRDGGDAVICDAGAVGPDYIPGHAHGDVFSFELSLDGRRVIVDSGVHDYVVGEWRDYCRSTRAHNTVEVGGHDQCEFWGAFRVGRRPRVHEVHWQPAGNGFELSGWHDGYRALPGAPRHERTFRRGDAAAIAVDDRVVAGRPQQVRSRIHLHPDCEIESIDGDVARVRYPGGRFVVRFRGDGALSQEPSTYCPEFGVRTANVALVRTAYGRRVACGYSVERGEAA